MVEIAELHRGCLRQDVERIRARGVHPTLVVRTDCARAHIRCAYSRAHPLASEQGVTCVVCNVRVISG